MKSYLYPLFFCALHSTLAQQLITLEAHQLIYHGGRIAANIKLREADLQTQQQQLVVSLYALSTRINQIYFRVLW